ncbi:unnamed protein product [Clonostachys chloroleuca]|uniref:Aconitase A/isopropylmalate dehydratase small subunit swivel domain-containing protein n=1 Tax=Clonostachys chloroleuca TaxID=1926264 RepID=A0AA35Q687_9HYPO|nr:unnamed protein product [Clonostachys chloroleuca]
MKVFRVLTPQISENKHNKLGTLQGKYTCQDNVPKDIMAKVRMENYDAECRTTAEAGGILTVGYDRHLSKTIPLVVAGSFGNIFSRNSINNTLLGVELPALITEKDGFS